MGGAPAEQPGGESGHDFVPQRRVCNLADAGRGTLDTATVDALNAIQAPGWQPRIVVEAAMATLQADWAAAP